VLSGNEGISATNAT